MSMVIFGVLPEQAATGLVASMVTLSALPPATTVHLQLRSRWWRQRQRCRPRLLPLHPGDCWATVSIQESRPANSESHSRLERDNRQGTRSAIGHSRHKQDGREI